MINLKSSPLAVIDVETSGINPFRNEILAVGIVPLLSDAQPLELYVRPKKIEWSPYAKDNFQKFSKKWNTHAVDPSVACDAIEKYLLDNFAGNQVTPIGHNVGFDVSFLKRLAFFGGRDEISGLSHRAIDTHTILYLLYLQNKIPQSALNSDGAFRHFGIRVPDAARHTAVGDALATKELILKLFDFLGCGFASLPGDGRAVIHK